ncbi:MAG: oligoendopeptidase F [Oscillospiraceae bacterium]|nr:oligoendopeptidase F [Oscillospiraceae bacterium]
MTDAAKWDLRRMYPTDELWNEKLNATLLKIDELAEQRGKINSSAEELFKTISLYESVFQDITDLAVFSRSNFDQNMADSAAKALNETLMTAMTAVGEKISFLAPEFMQGNYESFESFCEQLPELKKYDTFIKDFLAKKEHILPEEQEMLMVRMGDIGSTFSKIYDDLTVNDVEYPTVKDPDGNDFAAIEANYSIALGNPDRAFRERFFKALLGTYQKHKNTLTSLYYGSVKNDVFTAKSRNYVSAREMSLSDNFIPETVYDNLITTVRENTKPLQDYIELRRQVLGIEDAVHFYDLFVPIVSDVDRTYTYEEAQELIINATAVLGEDYTQLIKRAFSERWIDVYPTDNKQTGAYSTGSYTSYPYILLNFSGTLDSVFTLAHELGHSMHTWYSNHTQPFIYCEYSLFCAEVASTLNELLLCDYLMKNTTSDAEKALLLDKKLNDIRSTFYRQTMFADFENSTHSMVEEGYPLIPDTLTTLHGELNSTYYGEKFVVDEELRSEWSRIPHFYRAFYVYQYATGIAAATAIANRILTLGAPAVEDYRRFLSGGGSLHPIEMLRVAGVDMESPQPILDTIADFERTLDQLRPLLKK